MTTTWKVEIDGKQYVFDPGADLTVGGLRHFKSWYGEELGRYQRFLRAFAEGDPDAMACVVWVLKRKAGESTPEPQNMPDFGVGDFIDHWELEVDPEAVPTPEGPTQDSTPTSTSSGDLTLGSSATSATSPLPESTLQGSLTS